MPEVTIARADAEQSERKRSALVGVGFAYDAMTRAHSAHMRERRRVVDAIVAARDEGATVAEIAEQAGISRNAVYLLVSRARYAKAGR